MLKMIGAVLIICGTTSWGLCSVIQMKNRVRALNALVWSFDMMKDEICTNLTPMPELLSRMASYTPKPACEFFKKAAAKTSDLGAVSFREIWASAVDETPSLYLRGDEKEILYELGGRLGRYDFESCGRAIQAAKNRLEKKAEQAERDRRMNSRLHAFLGVAAGMFAVVVLL